MARETIQEIKIKAIADVADATAEIKKLSSAINSLVRSAQKLGNGSEFTVHKSFTFKNPFRIIYEDAQKAYANAKKANKETAKAMSLVPVEPQEQTGPKIDLDSLLNGTEQAKGKAEELKTVYGSISARIEAIKKKYNDLKKTQTFQKMAQDAKTFKSMLGKVTEFFSSLKRIAMYRLMRSIIKQITQGFMDAYKAMYKWSQAGNDNNQFANSMDKIVTALHYIHASLAALASPIINAIAPVIDDLADKFVNLLNIINQVIATIGKQDGWTRAIKKQITYGDTLNETNKKAKELKKTLLGIDEINLLNGANDSGTTDTSDLFDFEWVTWDKDNGLHNFFEDWDFQELFAHLTAILAIIEGIKLAIKGANFVGGALLGAAAAQEFWSAFQDVWTDKMDWWTTVKLAAGTLLAIAAGRTIGKAFGNAVGGAAVGGILAGAMIATTGFVDIVRNGINWINSIAVLAGSVLAGMSVAILAGASALAGGLVGLLVGVIALVVATIIDKWDYLVEYWKTGVEGIKRLIFAFGNFCLDIFEKITNYFIDGWNKALLVFNKIFGTNFYLPEIKFNRFSKDTFESVWNTYLSPETQGKMYYLYDKVGDDVNWRQVSPYLREALTNDGQIWGVKSYDKEEVGKMVDILTKNSEESTQASTNLADSFGGLSTSLDGLLNNIDFNSISTDLSSLATDASAFGEDGTIAMDLNSLLEKVDSIINNQLNGNNKQGDVYLDGDKVGKVMSKKSTIERKSLDLYNQVGVLTY